MFLFLSLFLFSSPSNAVVLDQVEYVIMRDSDGDEERLKGKSKGLGQDKMADIIFDIPVKLSKKTFRCDSSKETDWRLEKKVESQLELQGIIDALLKLDKPRLLSPAQQAMLRRVPICEPYMLQLKIISRLLKGYDLVRIEKRDKPRKSTKIKTH